MKTCGEFSVHHYVVPLRGARDCVRIIPFGDVHRDADSHAAGEWKAWLDYARRQKNAFFLGMGDYLDGYSCSERAILAHDGIHETSRRRMERDSMTWVKTLARELQPLAPRLIGLIGGNHYPTFADGTTGDQHLARELGTRFLGVAAAIRLSLQPSTAANSSRQSWSLDIFAHHGRGSARTVGGGLNGVEKLTDVAEADIYLMGDDHKAACSPIGQRLRIVPARGAPSGLCVRARTPWVARTGSFTRGYDEGVSSYVVDAALPPTTLGWVEFTVRVAVTNDRRWVAIDGTTCTTDGLHSRRAA